MKSKNLFKILRSKGFKNVKLDNIIESKYVLKRSGGSYRQFLFSFYDQNQKEWSLVPDLSVSSVVKFVQNKINTKIEIKSAVEKLFSVKVKSVNIINIKGKLKRFKGVLGKRKDVKKAVITLEEGNTIDISAGV